MVIAAGDELFTNYKAQNISRWGIILTRRLRAVFYLHPFTYILFNLSSCDRSGIQTGKTAPGGRSRDNSSPVLLLFRLPPLSTLLQLTNTAISTQALYGSEISANSPVNTTITGLILSFRDRFYKALKLL